MNEHFTTCHFVAKKVKKICWQKALSGHISRTFCTGSWDDYLNNEVAIWHVDSSDENEYSFQKSSWFKTQSDVEDLQFVTNDKLLYSSARGDLVMLNYNSAKAEISELTAWKSLHSGACNSFSLSGSDVVTAGEDGRLKVVNLNKTSSVLEVTSRGVSAPFYCVAFYGVQEIVTGNAVGQLQLWDCRDKLSDCLTRTLMSGVSNCGSVTSLRCHPSQQHLVIAGYQSGLVVFWDLRKFDFPSAAIRIHNGPVWDIQFHEFYPTNFYTASNDGCLIHWDASTVQHAANVLNTTWFLSDSLQNKLKLNNILPDNTFPVNSVDVQNDQLLTCTDNEALFLISNMNIC